MQKDEDEASRLGIQGTPVFFINGRLLSGAQPASEFVRIIEDELNKPRSDRGAKTPEVDTTLRNTLLRDNREVSTSYSPRPGSSVLNIKDFGRNIVQ